jgi:8-oxo-dGTP pyrophosphatase MutT (NUDIX family)
MVGMERRPAVKGIIPIENNEFIFVVGKSGRANLPGGGPEPGDADHEEFDTDVATFLREAEEEIGLSDNELHNIRPAFPFTIQGQTTSAEGIERLAIWTVLTADLWVTQSSLRIPDNSEVKEIVTMNADQCLRQRDRNMSQLAKRAIDIYTRIQHNN